MNQELYTPLENVGVLILAAGSSTRLQRPKQLLRLNDKSLVQYSVATALEITKNVVVVVGASADEVRKDLAEYSVDIIYNEDYKEGISSSIRVGVRHIANNYFFIEDLILMVCDQPYVSSDLLRQLIGQRQSSTKPIVACTYNETVGTPVLFYRNYFDVLQKLQGDIGAKKIIQQHSQDIATVAFAKGGIDVDTEEDYAALAK